MSLSQPQIRSPDDAIRAMTRNLSPVESERIATPTARGRLLAQDVAMDRDSPPVDVSAMDGYALRMEDLGHASLRVSGEARIGCPPPAHQPESVTRIYTGSPLPEGADCVLKREDVIEHETFIEIPFETRDRARKGLHIRRRGENARAGDVVIGTGTLLTPPAMGTLASIGVPEIRVSRRVRVHVIVTGDELRDPHEPVGPCEIRESNGPTICSTLDALPWIDALPASRVPDDPDRIRRAIRSALEEADALLLSGGVSMGRYDFIPSILDDLGCEQVFHRLDQRPGKPMLGAIAPGRKAVLALPGNPVSVLCTLHRIAVPVLSHLAGLRDAPRPPVVELADPDGARLALTWYRPVILEAPGRARLVAHRGSGDLPSISSSDGFIEVPAGADGPGPYPFHRWIC